MMNIGKLISTVLLAAAGTFTLTLTTNASQLLYFILGNRNPCERAGQQWQHEFVPNTRYAV